MSALRKLSLIVPAFNEEKLLGETLSQINHAARVVTSRGWQTELIVCDNNSTDGTAAIAQAAGARVVFEPVNQIARARNRGAEEATGSWLCFIDADSLPSAALFSRTLDAIESTRFVAIGTTLQFDNVPWYIRVIAQAWKGWSLFLSHMAGSFVVVDARAFRELGGFSDEFFVGEEVDLSVRLKKWGKQQSSVRAVKVLRGVPLRTSGRKAHLYSARENGRFLWRVMTSPFRTMKRKEDCDIWYDGRR
ncbi:MAG: glycosyltransferase family A protein [Synoicihabitans sp.]